jgi:hypothetical protein
MKKVLPLAFTDLGAQQVKNIKGPIRAYIVADWLTLQALAKERGVKFGRQSVLNPNQRCMVAFRHAQGSTVRDPAKDFNVGVLTIVRALIGP